MTCEPAKNSESAKHESATTAHCPACELSERQPLSGVYQFTCVSCCARLVMSAHPDKRQANAMLAAIARYKHAPGRDTILECVRQVMTRHRSVTTKQLSL